MTVTNDARPLQSAGARRRHSSSTDGFTLIELLVVLGILALLVGVAAPQVLRYLGTARTETARLQVRDLASAVELYYLDVGAYPPAEVGLDALVEAPAQVKNWRGPYLRKTSALLDPWGRPYTYRVPGKNGEFEIYSLGRDGVQNGSGEDADIVH